MKLNGYNEERSMSTQEFVLYCICEEFHQELRKNVLIKETPIEIARLLQKKLPSHQLEQITHDIYLINKRNGNAANYYILLVYPLLLKYSSAVRKIG
jgi:hypothetical protein